MLPTVRDHRYQIDWYLAIPVLGPTLLMMAGNPDFMFDQPGWVDPFGLLGRFWHWSEQNPLFEEYKNSRLPWILPGFIVHRLFESVTASYILHAITLVSAAIALYLVLRDALGDRPAAAVTAAAWSCYTWIHGDGGWDYHILAACTYYLFSIWMFVRAAMSAERARTCEFVAGAALACAIHTHLVFAGFVPIVAMIYGIVLGRDVAAASRRVASAAGYALLGGLAVTAVFAAVNAATGGPLLFFLPQIEFTLLLSQGNRWVVPAWEWIGGAYHLLVPCLILAAGVIWLVAGRLRGARDNAAPARFARILVYQGLLVFGLFAYLQFVAGQTVLYPSYASYPLYTQAFLMLGALLSHSGYRGRWAAVFTAMSALAIVGPLLLLLPSRLPWLVGHAVQLFRLPSPLALLLTIGGVGLVLICGLKRSGRLAAFAVFFGLFNACAPIFQTSYGIGTPGINRDTLRVIRSLDRYTSSLDPTLFAIRFWREQEMVPGPFQPINMFYVFDSFLSTRRRSFITAAYDRPEIRAEQLTRDDLYTERCLGVLSTTAAHGEVVGRIKRRFRELGLPLIEVGQHHTVSGPISVALTVLALPPDATTVGYEDVPCPPRR